MEGLPTYSLYKYIHQNKHNNFNSVSRVDCCLLTSVESSVTGESLGTVSNRLNELTLHTSVFRWKLHSSWVTEVSSFMAIYTALGNNANILLL